MKYVYRESEVFYRFHDRKREVTNIYLHGWGCDHKSLLFCDELLTKENSLFVDFPPFGQSGEISDWSIFTYANMIISLCHHLKIERFNLIGHSFGGRVAILMAVLCKHETQKLVLVDSAGLKPKRGLGYYYKVYLFKIRKHLGLDVSNFGSCDYRRLDDNMKQIFKSVINTFLDDFLPVIDAETLIIFGQNDHTTPISMAKKFHRKIKNSKLVLIEDAGHFPFLDRKVEFDFQLQNFIER